MMRTFMAAMLIGCCLAAAPAPATPASVAPASATRPSRPPIDLDALHVQAFAAMQSGDAKGAQAAMEQVWSKTPPAQRTRALVLNHAVLDLTQKVYVMRGLKDLTEYLTKNRDPDEHATNILGGALNVAVVTNPKLRQGALWQTALREWDRRNYVLDHSRKGWRRWGTRWVSDEEHAQIQAEIQSLKQGIADQQASADRAYDRAWSISQQYSNAVNAREKNRYIIQYLQYYGNQGVLGGINTNLSDPNFGQYQPSAVASEAVAAAMEAQRLGPEMQVAIKEFQREMTKLAELQNRVVRPKWPTRFEPVDPHGPEAEKPLPTTNPSPLEKVAEPESAVPGKPLPPARRRVN